MVKAVFIDFYGTLVHEDGKIIKQISQAIYDTGKVDNKSEIGAYWWNEFQSGFNLAYGDNFETQRVLEYKSLAKTVKYFNSTVDAKELSNLMFEHWMNPPIFEESMEFFKQCPVPIYIVSNIDRDDILQAIKYHNLTPNGVFTSEDARSYKPRKELFELALKSTKLDPKDVVHIGDSLSSDVKGATSVGINTIWINRGNREVPKGVNSVDNLLDVFNTKYFI